jgi:hypothetical protein
MQTSVPELTDISKEPKEVLEMYGPQVTEPGTYAYNCLLARRLAERDVRFVQVFLRGWDHHGNLPASIKQLTGQADQPTAALLLESYIRAVVMLLRAPIRLAVLACATLALALALPGAAFGWGPLRSASQRFPFPTA